MMDVSRVLWISMTHGACQSLTVLDFLVANGAERVIDELREQAFQVQVRKLEAWLQNSRVRKLGFIFYPMALTHSEMCMAQIFSVRVFLVSSARFSKICDLSFGAIGCHICCPKLFVMIERLEQASIWEWLNEGLLPVSSDANFLHNSAPLF